MKYLLDTNICIYIRRQRPIEVLAKFRLIEPGDLAISVVTHGELMFGAMKSTHRNKTLAEIAEFVTLVPALELPQSAARHYARVRATLELKGEPIGGNDLWIAAHALAANLILVTNNEREFKRVPGLRVQNWVAAP